MSHSCICSFRKWRLFTKFAGMACHYLQWQALLLHTVHLCGITLSNCYFPPTMIVELAVDAIIHHKVFTYMPNLRVLDIWDSFLWTNGDRDPISLPMLEWLTWGSLSIPPLFRNIITPALQYTCLTTPNPEDMDYEEDVDLQDFPDAIKNSSCIPLLPNLDELQYDIKKNYTADCIFVGLPRVSLIQFLLQVDQSNWELCSDFFKALVDDLSLWPYMRTIIFKTLPDQLFNPLHDFMLPCSSEEHQFTIDIERDNYTHSNTINARHMAWLQQHINVEIVPPKA